MAKVIGKILLWISGILITMVVIALATLTVLWLKPELILTDQRIDQLYEQFGSPYFVQKPEKLKIELRPNTFFGKHIYIDVSSFCLKEPDGCFEQVHIELAFRFIALTKVKIEKIGPIKIINRYLTFHESKSPPEPEKKSDSDKTWLRYVSIPPDLKVDDIDIQSPKVTLAGKDPVIISGVINGAESDHLHIEAHAKTATGLKANALVDTGFTLDGSNEFHAKLEASDNWTIDGELTGDVNWTKLEGEVKGGLKIRKLIPWVDTLSVNHIELKRKGNLSLKADLQTRLEPKFNFQARSSALPKVSFNTDIDGKLNVVEKEGVFDYKILLGPLSQKGIELQAHVEGKYPFPKATKHRYGVDKALVRLDVPKFGKLVHSLSLTSAAIPAPFSALRGKIHFQAGQSDANILNETLPVEFVTELNSKEQTVQTHSGGKVVFDRAAKKIKVEGESKVNLIRFTLPDLDVLTPQPMLSTDSRIVSIKKIEKQIKEEKIESGEEEAPADSTVQVTWKVTTASNGIQVNYPVFHPYAPAEVVWNVSTGNANASSSGEIKLLPFGVEYLNRKARLKSLRYYLEPGEKIFHYDGELIVPKTDYTIFIHVFDQTGKPKVEFTSEPPLDQADIISVLLFNQTTSELTPDESGSVANTQAAVTNRALGLFSIWALSSTPIEAVNFNPSTKVYSARVRLANGLTASIGTDWENTQEVALRKRLGRNWVLSTSVQTDKETNTESKKTLLEWFKRF
jgi:hypothetical protein